MIVTIITITVIIVIEINLFEITIKLDPAAMLPRRFAGNNHDAEDDEGDEDDDDDSFLSGIA